MSREQIRPLTLSELQILIDWARAEGWNPGLDDAAAFHAADPDGFLGCFVDGRMAAGLSAVRYGADFGFIGLYIAHPDFRGRGHGRNVWDAGMAHLGGRTIGLDGVPEQQANYRSMGFAEAYRTIRWSGVLKDAGPHSPGVSLLTDVGYEPIVAYDRLGFPAARNAFLKAWLMPPRITRIIIRREKLAGYVVCRKCHDGYKIGPLFADTVADAKILLHACAGEAGGAALSIDVPEAQHDFSRSLAALGFTRGFETARMYRGAPAVVAGDQVFGVTTLELG